MGRPTRHRLDRGRLPRKRHRRRRAQRRCCRVHPAGRRRGRCQRTHALRRRLPAGGFEHLGARDHAGHQRRAKRLLHPVQAGGGTGRQRGDRLQRAQRRAPGRPGGGHHGQARHPWPDRRLERGDGDLAGRCRRGEPGRRCGRVGHGYGRVARALRGRRHHYHQRRSLRAAGAAAQRLQRRARDGAEHLGLRHRQRGRPAPRRRPRRARGRVVAVVAGAAADLGRGALDGHGHLCRARAAHPRRRGLLKRPEGRRRRAERHRLRAVLAAGSHRLLQRHFHPHAQGNVRPLVAADAVRSPQPRRPGRRDRLPRLGRLRGLHRTHRWWRRRPGHRA